MGAVQDKVALITGGAQGIGRALAEALAAEGAAVVVNDLGGTWNGEGSDDRAATTAAAEITAAGGQAVADHGDVSDSGAAIAMVQRAVESFGGLDIVINCAGILRDKMLVSMADEDWDAVQRVHLRGHYAVSQAAARFWRTRAKEIGGPVDARLICFSSEAGYYGNAGQVNYSAAKGGIVSFALAAARELERYGVTSNVIAPRARTRMTEGTFGDAFPAGENYDTWDPSNVAATVVFLVSDAGGKYTSQVLVAGGGVIKLIDPYTVVGEIRNDDRAHSQGEIEALFAEVRGPAAPVPPFPLLEEVLGNAAG